MAKNILLFGISVFALSLYLFWVKNSDQNTAKLVSPVWATTVAKSTDKLSLVVEKSLEGTTGTYAVAIKNYQTNEEYYSNIDRVFISGSLYKLWVMAVVAEKLEKKIISKDDAITEDIAALNTFFGLSDEDAELTRGTVNFTVGSALEQMITISHNYAAMSLVKKIGSDSIKSFLVKQKFSGSAIKSPPQTTARDISAFMDKLYRKDMVSTSSSQMMIDLMLKQQLKEGLPKYLPPSTKIAHKTGELYLVKHGAGIVYGPKNDYSIVVLSESNSPFGAEERIALLSKDVYNYFEN